MSLRRTLIVGLLALAAGSVLADDAQAWPVLNRGYPHYWGWRLNTLYSPLHYWTPGVFYMRAYCHPRIYAQYAPGPYASVPPIVIPEDGQTGTSMPQRTGAQPESTRPPEQLPAPMPVPGVLSPQYVSQPAGGR